MTARAEEIDEPEESAVEHDEATPRRVSFFASSAVLDADLRDYAAWIEIEEADEAVCARVWEIFAKDSTARGFDARSARSKRASAALAERRASEGVVPGGRGWVDHKPEAVEAQATKEDSMGREKGSDGLTDQQRAVRDAWHGLALEGREFNNGDIARRAGITGGSATSRSANVSTVLKRLRAIGLVDAGERAAPPATRESTKPKAAATAKSEPPQKAKDDMGRRGPISDEDGLTDKQRAVLVAWHELKRAKGDDFTNTDVANRAGSAGNTAEAKRANVSNILRVLRRRGLLAPATPPRVPVAASVPSPQRPPVTPDGATLSARRAPATDEDPLVTSLLVRREAAVAQVAKLDAAIAAVRAAS